MSLIPMVYRSSDAGAPALTGQVGSFRNLLDAVLVTGYGDKPAAGWTKEFAATNKAVYRNNPVTGSGGFLQIDDSSTASGSNARYALARAYEIMTAIDTGTGPTPSVSQSTNGVAVLKSKDLTATERAWLILASETFFIFFVDVGATASGWVGVPSWACFMGDFVKRKTSDDFNFLVLGANSPSFTGSQSENGSLVSRTASLSSTPSTGYLLRDYSGAESSVRGGPVIGLTARNGVFGGNGDFPDPVSGGLMYDKIYVSEGPNLIRGYLPNVYEPFHDAPFETGVERSDISSLPGTTILPMSINSSMPASVSSSSRGQLLLDITNYWG